MSVARFGLRTRSGQVSGLIQGNSASIITNGLVLNLDAGNPASYPGTGTTWTDLSGSGNNGTLTNGPTFNSGNAGNIVLDGVNDFVNIGNPANIQFTRDSTFTISIWLKHTFATTCNIFSKQLNSGNFSGWGLGINGAGNKLQWFTYDNGGLIVDFPSAYNNNTWTYVCISHSANTLAGNRLYINGINVASTQILAPASSNIVTNANIQISGRGGANNVWGGSVAIAHIYNIALSDAEILQNYNATNTRFI